MKIRLKNRKNFILWYSVAFAGVALVIFLPLILKGNTLVGSADACNQYYPVFVYIGNYIRECVMEGRLKQFDFTIGLGEGIIPALNYYGFGDPLNLLAAFFSIETAPWGFSALILVRLYLCGISMAVFLRKIDVGWRGCFLASLAYAFSSFALAEGLRFYTWLTGMLLLPLIMAGAEEILDGKRKVSWLFILSVCIQALNGFYFLYMDTVFGILFYLAVHVGRKHTLAETMRRGWYLAGSYLWGICMSAVILLPAVLGYLGSARSGGGVGLSLRSALFYDTEMYKDLFSGVFVGRGYGEGAIALLFMEAASVLLLFTVIKGAGEWKILTALLGAGYLMPVMGYLMNGFAYVTDRWIYLLHFVLAVVLALAIDRNAAGEASMRHIVCLGIPAVSSLMIHLSADHDSVGDFLRFLLYAGCLLLLLTVLWFGRKKGNGKKERCSGRICLLTIGNLVLNGCMIFWPVAVGGDGFSSYFMSEEQLRTAFQESAAGGIETQRGEFYRSEVYDKSYGVAMALGFNGTTEYLSILNRNISDFFMELEISPGIHGSTWNLCGLDTRKNLQDLLSVRYYLSKDELKENENALPLGVAFSSWMSEKEFEKLSVPEKDSVLIQTVVLGGG